LDALERPIHTLLRLSEPTTKILMKIDPYCQRQKCIGANDSSFWRYKIYANIRGGSRVYGASDDSGGCRERQFSAFSVAIFSDTLDMRPVLLYSDMQSVVGFSVIPKYFTLNDFDWLFRVIYFFRAGLAG